MITFGVLVFGCTTFLCVGIGLGMFLTMLYGKARPRPFYEGKVVMHGTVTGPIRDSTGNSIVPTSILNVSFRGKYDGRATLQFEGDCTARDALEQAQVRDVWRIILVRVKDASKRVRRVKWNEINAPLAGSGPGDAFGGGGPFGGGGAS